MGKKANKYTHFVFVRMLEDGRPEFRAGDLAQPGERVYFGDPGISQEFAISMAKYFNRYTRKKVQKYENLESLGIRENYRFGVAVMPFEVWPYANKLVKIGDEWYSVVRITEEAFKSLG